MQMLARGAPEWLRNRDLQATRFGWSRWSSPSEDETMITYFKAQLRCPQCESTSEAEMYTELLDAPGTTILHVGDQADIDPSDYQRAFLVVYEIVPSTE